MAKCVTALAAKSGELILMIPWWKETVFQDCPQTPICPWWCTQMCATNARPTIFFLKKEMVYNILKNLIHVLGHPRLHRKTQKDIADLPINFTMRKQRLLSLSVSLLDFRMKMPRVRFYWCSHLFCKGVIQTLKFIKRGITHWDTASQEYNFVFL